MDINICLQFTEDGIISCPYDGIGEWLSLVQTFSGIIPLLVTQLLPLSGIRHLHSQKPVLDGNVSCPVLWSHGIHVDFPICICCISLLVKQVGNIVL